MDGLKEAGEEFVGSDGSGVVPGFMKDGGEFVAVIAG
jgi:hypothetical protein